MCPLKTYKKASTDNILYKIIVLQYGLIYQSFIKFFVLRDVHPINYTQR